MASADSVFCDLQEVDRFNFSYESSKNFTTGDIEYL